MHGHVLNLGGSPALGLEYNGIKIQSMSLSLVGLLGLVLSFGHLEMLGKGIGLLYVNLSRVQVDSRLGDIVSFRWNGA